MASSVLSDVPRLEAVEKKAVAAAPSHTAAAAAAAAPACDDEPDGCIGCILPSILGDSGPAEKMLGHPPWTRPQQGVDVGLRVNNSLVGPEGRAAKSDELVPFIPAVGKQVKWYTCGPTVYVFITVEKKKILVLFSILYNMINTVILPLPVYLVLHLF